MVNIEDLDEQDYEALTQVVIENCITILDMPNNCVATEDLTEAQDTAWSTIKTNIKQDLHYELQRLSDRRKMLRRISEAIQERGNKNASKN